MVRIKYIGDISPCRIKVKGVFFKNWKRGEVRDVSDDVSELILSNKHFVLDENKKSSKKSFKEKPEEEEVSYVKEEEVSGDYVDNDYKEE